MMKSKYGVRNMLILITAAASLGSAIASVVGGSVSVGSIASVSAAAAIAEGIRRARG